MSPAAAPSPSDERDRAIAALGSAPLDVLVVGGGITGAGVVRDATLRGLRAALVEQGDFGSGTSSRSTKLVHGGLRYLEQGALGLVFESVNERRRLMRLARHLVRPLPFLVPRYRGDRRWLPTLTAGLWLYDALCVFKSYRMHQTLLSRATLALEPGLRAGGLHGAVRFYDCQTDDARLTLENVLDARAEGATTLNGARATGLLRDGSGRVVGATVHERERGRTIEVRAKVLVNATGPWCDELRAMLDEPPLLRPTKGVHAVVSSERLPLSHAIMMQSPTDGRVVFAIPWGPGRSVVGTTDSDYVGDPARAAAERPDVEYLLAAANAYFPSARLALDDVLATWAGLRPLLRPPSGAASASQVSREHVVLERPGLVTVAGGKLTTYRTMADEVVGRVLSQLGTFSPCRTGRRPLPGAVGLEGSDAELEALARALEARGLAPALAGHLAHTYGARASAVAERIRRDPAAGEPLADGLPTCLAQVDEAVLHELARSLGDVMERRTQLFHRAVDQGLDAAPRVAARMAALLGWSETRTADELGAYAQEVEASRRFRTEPRPPPR